MPTKPVPGLGLVIGVIVGYAGIIGASHATTQLVRIRQIMFDSNLARSGPWLALLLAVAVVLGVLMAVPAIGAGVMTGVGGLLTVVGLAFLLLPPRQAFDLSKLFEVPGTRVPAYMLFDGSLFVFGFVILIVGVRRWASDAKVARLLAAEGQALNRGYHPTFPAQPAPQQPQWGSYPGQQQQYGGYPGQPQPRDYSREQRPQDYPGQRPPGEQQPPR
jgi:hypothetical protein